jgi:hypothetical protein
MLHLTHVHVLYVKPEQVPRDYAPALRSSLKHVDRSLRHAAYEMSLCKYHGEFSITFAAWSSPAPVSWHPPNPGL